MSELREDTRQQIKLVLKEIPAHIAKLEVHDYSYYIDKILSIPELAIVDRDAKLPKIGSKERWLNMMLGQYLVELLKANWVKEVKENEEYKSLSKLTAQEWDETHPPSFGDDPKDF